MFLCNSFFSPFFYKHLDSDECKVDLRGGGGGGEGGGGEGGGREGDVVKSTLDWLAHLKSNLLHFRAELQETLTLPTNLPPAMIPLPQTCIR